MRILGIACTEGSSSFRRAALPMRNAMQPAKKKRAPANTS